MNPELKAALDALQQAVKEGQTALVAKLEAKILELKTSTTAMQTQLDALDLNMQHHHIAGDDNAPDGLKAMADAIIEHKADFERHGRIRFEIPTLLPEGKSVILSTGLTSVEPAAGIQGAGRFAYRLRTLFRSVPTELPTIGVLRSNVETLNASPQTEGSAKSESTITFLLVQVPVQTIAHFVNFSKQALDDIDSFQEFIRSTLAWDLERKAESEILSGDGTGVHLTGLVTDAVPYDSTILAASAGWNRIDILGAAAVQLIEAGYSPNFAVVSPRNWFRMVSLRDSTGQYVLNSPRTSMGERAYNLDVIPSAQMAGDGFLVGDASKAVIRQRQQTTFDLSREHGTNFTSNLITALAEERFGLQVLRPDAFVEGTLASSPA